MSAETLQQIGVDLLTGKPIYKEHPDNGLCPECGKHGITGDSYHLCGVCRICGYHFPGDD